MGAVNYCVQIIYCFLAPSERRRQECGVFQSDKGCTYCCDGCKINYGAC